MISCRPTSTGPVPVHPSFTGDATARRFWRLSFRCGREYISGTDALGQSILVQHEREEAESYRRRLRITKPRNMTGPIIRRYNGMVFKKPPVRDSQADEFWQDFWKDCDGHGTTIDAFMAESLLHAQVERECYIVPDVLGNPAAGTVAAIRASGSRPIIARISADGVVNWTEQNGVLVECSMIWHRSDGVTVLRWWGQKDRQDFLLDERQFASGQLVITGVEPPVVHGYERMPVQRLRPNLDPLGYFGSTGGDSQAGPIAESQQAITNLLSLLNEEISNVTFSQMIASGVSDSQVKDVMVGNTRVLCLPNPASSVQMIGADPAQATSIRESLKDETDTALRNAGVIQGGEQAQSGVALAFRHNDMVTIVSALACGTEDAENDVTVTIAGGWGVDAPAPTNYQGKDSDLPDFAGEATTLVSIVSNASLPMVIRRKVAERFAGRNLGMSNDDMQDLRTEMEAGKLALDSLRTGNPFPDREGGGMEDAKPEIATVEKVQDTALNGAQIASLVELLSAVGAGTLAPEAAVLAITNSFPVIDDAEARKMIAAQAKLEPPAPAPAKGGKPPAESPDPEDEAEDDEDPEDETKTKPE
jgi:hypothetical protein